jgi:serine protease Do
MKKFQSVKRTLPIILGLLTLPTLGLAHMPSSVSTSSSSTLAPMLKKSTPAVVNIAVEKVILTNSGQSTSDASGDQNVQPTKIVGVGSGVIVDAHLGYIITNAHVVKDQTLMVVTLKDGRRYRGKLIAKDDNFDIAIIQIQAKELTAMPFGDSNKLTVGDFVIAVGSPFNLNQTVTSGIISALNRQLQPNQEVPFIQTDAPINLGNSGGALINLSGELIGINTAIVTPDTGNIGIGLSIPSDMAKSVYEQLKKYGKVQPGILGVTVQSITPELADVLKISADQGVLVSQVSPDSAAAKVGLQPKDVILSVNGVVIKDNLQLHNIMQLTRPHTEISIDIERAHHTKTLSVSVGDPQHVLQPQWTFLNGVRLQEIHTLEPDGTQLYGVLVLSVADTSNAAISGLLPGDIILSANGKLTSTIPQLTQMIQQFSQKRLLIRVSRDQQGLFLVLQDNKDQDDSGDEKA